MIWIWLTSLALLLIYCATQTDTPWIVITNLDVLPNGGDNIVIADGSLKYIYDDTTYLDILNCNNGDLSLINDSIASNITFSYGGLGELNSSNTYATAGPNANPKPELIFGENNTFILTFNCPSVIDNNNYYNKVDVHVMQYYFSFLLNCENDPEARHKAFQYGYLILSALDAVILVSVAMHSRIWSFKFRGKRLKFDLRWFHALIVCVIMVIVIAGLYLFAFNDFDSAFATVRYVGIGLSAIFVFICFNQSFFLVRQLRKPVFRIIRYCDIISLFLSIVVVLLSIFFQNWILYNFMAVCICVACIKLLHFSSLKEAYIFLGTVFITITVVSIVSHYVLTRSYNDYATQLTSPLFLQVPALVNNLYKQCSWLPVIDVIIPGSMLAYLRLYDENRSSKWGGVYTVWGNATFILSTILWIGIEAIYPFSVPFSLVTYPSLMIVILLLSWKRHQMSDLFRGKFYQESSSLIDESKLDQNQESFSDLVDKDFINPLKASKISSSEKSGLGSFKGQQYK